TDGRYEIKNIPPGSYTLRFSYIGYVPQTVTQVDIQPGKRATLDVVLTQESVIGQEVVVRADVIRSGEGALLAERRRAIAIGDGISAEQIKRAPDATSGDALKRVTGITLVDNKFVFIRGTSERYSNTTLNGATLSSVEPEKRSFSFDMFPSNLLENIVISKTFTPDMQGDFSGGNIQLTTIDFPDDFTMRVSVGNSFNTNSTTQSMTTYRGGSTDWLGIDDGTRALPSNLPSDFTRGIIPVEEQQAYARRFPDNWSMKTIKAPFNKSMDISIGNAYSVFEESQFGFVAALTYRNNYSHSQLERNDYEADRPKYLYTGVKDAFSVLWGTMANISFKMNPFHKFSLRNVYNRTADDEVVMLEGLYNDRPSLVKNIGFRYTERSIASTQVIGEHVFADVNDLRLQWRAAYSQSYRSEPDGRRVGYAKDATEPDEPYYAVVDYQAQTRSGGRFYSSLNDIVRNYAVDITLPIETIKLKIGGLYEDKDRSFNSRLIAFVRPMPGEPFDRSLLLYAVDSLFRPENVKSNGFRISEYSNGSNNYTAGYSEVAYYAMADVPFTLFAQNFRLNVGARVENFIQRVSSFYLDNSPINKSVQNVDVLPSVNFTYSLAENTNLRLAYSQTVNRPELRELAPFPYYDFTTQLTVYGNDKLRRALIRNYDVRWELFPNPGELLSVSYFYKKLTDAIEMVNVPGSALGSDRTFDNANGVNYGYEIEFRASLRHLSTVLSNFALTGNYTRVNSKVTTLTGIGLEKKDRPLQGQSPYMVNLSLLFSLPEYGFSTSVMFNKFGERISEASTLASEDIREMPRNVVDLTLTKTLFQHYEVKFSVKDLLHEAQVFKVKQGTTDQIARSNSVGTTYSLGISYKL
ncbi:MAG: TonB-dependent receptor, partial [Bacteroidota bacterium]